MCLIFILILHNFCNILRFLNEKKETDKTSQKHTFIKTIGIMTFVLFMFVGIAGAAPFAYMIGYGYDDYNGYTNESIYVVDIAKNAVTSTIPGDFGGPGVAVNPTGTKVYVANGNNVSVIDTATNKVTSTVKVGHLAYGIAVNTAGTKVYVTNGNSVSIINTATNKVTAKVDVGYSPDGVAVNTAGTKVYVANWGSNTTSIIDTATNKVIATVKVGTHPCGVTVNPTGTKVYVTNAASDNVSIINTAKNKVIATVKLESESDPSGIAITPDGKKAYVTCDLDISSDTGMVSIINTATNKVTAKVDIGYSPDGVAVTPDGKKVCVICGGWTEGGYGVYIIDTATNKVSDGRVGADFIPEAFGQFIGPSSTPQIKPVAAFSASPTSGTKPLKVQFTDKSTNTPTSWKWNFGDGTTSTTHNPLHTYIKKGKLTVTLTATNTAGSSAKTMSNYITVK